MRRSYGKFRKAREEVLRRTLEVLRQTGEVLKKGLEIMEKSMETQNRCGKAMKQAHTFMGHRRGILEGIRKS